MNHVVTCHEVVLFLAGYYAVGYDEMEPARREDGLREWRRMNARVANRRRSGELPKLQALADRVSRNAEAGA